MLKSSCKRGVTEVYLIHQQVICLVCKRPTSFPAKLVGGALQVVGPLGITAFR